MSNALAIAATTATLRGLLEKKVPDLDTELQDLEVTAQPPDVAGKQVTKARLNVFLYQTTVNGAWRNLDMPRQVRGGETGSPPLALDLHYLLTAYGRNDSDNDSISHRVLGGAMSVLHDRPVLDRGDIAAALNGNDLGAQFEMLKITSFPMGLEEMSKLWTVFQTQYRISAAYEVTVVLIDSRRPVKAALPVLRRGEEDRGVAAVAGAAPNLRKIRLPRSQSAARLGEDIAILGEQLTVEGTTVRFASTRALPSIELNPEAGPSPTEIAVRIPDDAPTLSAWAPGYYTISLVQRRSDVPPIVSNELPFALAPQIAIAEEPTQTPDGDFKKIELKLTCKPRILAGQRVLLLFGERQAEAVSIDTPPDREEPTTLVFVVRVPADTADAKFVVRLRVDGVDSVPVKSDATPPMMFDPDQTVTVA